MRSPSRGLRIASVGLTLAVVAFGLTACGKSGSSAASGSITIAINNAPTNLDPAKNGNTPANTAIMDLAYAPLIFQKGDGTFVPGLATSWKYIGSDKKTFELKLRQGVHFSDGSALTAKQVVASIEHEKTANGPVAIYANQIASAVAVNNSTVRLNLANSDPIIASILTQHFMIGSIVGPKGTSNPDSLGTSTDGAGQYMLDSSQTVANDHYTFVPNPHYYDPSAVHFKKFTVRIIGNAQTALSAIKSKQVAYAIGDFTTADQAAAAGAKVYATQSTWYASFIFDRDGTLVPALKSQLVRQALNYAVDRKAIIKALFGKYGTESDELSIKGYEKVGFDPSYSDHYNYDPTKAKALLAKAGYPNGFTMTIGSSPQYGNGDQMAQALAGYWKKVGITANIQNYNDINSLVTPWLGKKLPAVTGDYDAQPMYLFINQGLAKNAGTFNPFQTEDAQLNTLITKALAETNEAQQEKDWQAIQRRVVDLGWFVPVGVGDLLYYGASNLKGVTLSPTAFDPDPTQFHY